MDKERRETAEAIFQDALDWDDDSREERIRARCGGDPELEHEVHSLLAHHARGAKLLDKPLIERSKGAKRLTDPKAVGPYRILGRLGEGGFGVVYEAEQTQPVRRRVALKILKAGMDTEAVLARFAAEQQALALMDHSHIAKVFDSGATENGRSYFVMELVRGDPITEYADRNKVGMRQRIQLMVDLCNAVQHAHQRGVIHRDLKPPNVLVTTADGGAVAKIIDFGIAKAMATPLTDRTLHTVMGQLLGTPVYMSPEQAERSGQEVDTTTDIYSLGVLLYELACGYLPFDPKRLGDDPSRVARILRTVEPERPSRRIAEINRDNVRRARARGESALSLGRLLRGDLDWVVMKAMDKDRTRRYSTAEALAEDLQRILEDKPVHARPPSTAYRLKKFTRRNRLALTLTAIVGAALVGGAVALSLALVDAQRQRSAAELARNEAESVTVFLSSMLEAAQPDELGRDVTVREMLDRASRQLSSELHQNELVEARLRTVMGATYRALGEAELARGQLESARGSFDRELGPESQGSIQARRELGWLDEQLGEYDSARSQFEALLSVVEARDGRHSRAYLETADDLIAVLLEAEQVQDAYELLTNLMPEAETLPVNDPLRSKYLADMGVAEHSRGNHAAAEPYLLESLELDLKNFGRRHSRVAAAQQTLGALYRELGRYDEAEVLYRQAYDSSVETMGQDHPVTVRTRSNLALMLSDLGRYDEALVHSEAVVQTRTEVLGARNPRTLASRLNLALLYQRMGRLEDALDAANLLARDCRAELGADHLYTIVAQGHVGKTRRLLGDAEGAVEPLRSAVESAEENLGAQHWRTASIRVQLGAALALSGSQVEGREMLMDGERQLRESLGDEHPLVLEAVELMNEESR